jgi:hypothetical protein
MPIKYAASTAAVLLGLCTAIDPAPAAAQAPNCVDMYSHVMALYQSAPLSPEYNQMAAAYAASCLRGASFAPTYPAPAPDYGAPVYTPVYPATSYGYTPAPYPYYGYDYPSYAYGYDSVPVGVGLGFGFRGGFHHGDFHRGDRGGRGDRDRHH